MRQAFDVLWWRSEIALVRIAVFLISQPDPFELSPDLHRFFADRYLRLAHYHRERGRTDRATRLYEKACEHWHAFDPDEPPPAMAAVMPVPIPPIFTWAVAKPRVLPRPRKAA